MRSINIEQLKQDLHEAGYTEQELKILLLGLPTLGPNTLEFLSNQITKLDFPTLKPAIFRVVSRTAAYLKELESGSSEDLHEFIAESLQNGNYNSGIWVIPLVLDVLTLIRAGKLNPSPELVAAINAFELAMFQYLPDEEIQEIVETNVLFFLKNNTLLMELKSLFLVSSITGEDAWMDSLLSKLQENNESLGANQITVEGKQLAPMVGNWIKDYIAAVPKSLEKRNTFDQIQYIKSSKNTSALTAPERELLLGLIKLYTWLLYPDVTEKEIDEYEAEKKGIRYEPQVLEESTFPLPPPPRPPKPPINIAEPESEPVTLPKINPLVEPAPRPFPLPLAKPLPSMDVLQKQTKTKFTMPAVHPVEPPVDSSAEETDDLLDQKIKLQHAIDDRLDQLKKKVRK